MIIGVPDINEEKLTALSTIVGKIDKIKKEPLDGAEAREK